MALWAGKWLISTMTGTCGTVALVFALSLPNIYTASALVMPAETWWGAIGFNETIRWSSWLSRSCSSQWQ